MKRIYLDYAATTPVHPEVVKAMMPYFSDEFGNASASHSYGQKAKAAINEAREKVAVLIGSQSDEIIFTSGGTEANNFAIKGLAYANRLKGNHIITSTIEHHSVLETCKFLKEEGIVEVSYLPVDKYGLVNPQDVRKAITSKTILISIMHANNEIGTIEPIAEIGNIATEAKVYFHTDAVQTTGHIAINVDEIGVDLLSISAHKLHGPKGAGALYVRKGTRLASLMHGGGQEQSLRASTENIPCIVGFGKAAELAVSNITQEANRLTCLRDKLIEGLLEKMDHVHLNGHPAIRLPGNVNISIDHMDGEPILQNLDSEGICASTGAACSSSSTKSSHVLLALGQSPEQIQGSLRFTLGLETSEEDIVRLLDVLPGIVEKVKNLSELERFSPCF